MRRVSCPKLPALALLALWPACALAIVTFNVNSTADNPDDIHDGVCADAFGKCTLRAAIMEANLGGSSVSYVINLPAGTYKLTRGVTNPDDHSNGDLDVNVSTVAIHGGGSAKTIVDANHLDRAFKVSSTGYLQLYDLTIINGQPSSLGGRPTAGGAILDLNSLSLVRCVLDSNSATGGGAVAALPDGSYTAFAIAVSTTFSRNIATGEGGGFYAYSTTATFDACTFWGNSALDGGGLNEVLGTLYMQNSTLYQNTAADYGGGMVVFVSTASLYSMTFGGNVADSDQNGEGSGGGIYDTNSTVTVSNSAFANLNELTHGNDDCSTYQATLTFSYGNVLRSVGGCSYSGLVYEGDPLLGLLKDNGGPTPTEMPSPAGLAVNQGPAGGCTGIDGGVLTRDQRGVKRPIGSACDLGAVELEPVGDVNGDGSVTVADVFYLVNFLFAGGAAPLGRANVNGDSAVSVTDVFYLINYLFAGGAAPI